MLCFVLIIWVIKNKKKLTMPLYSERSGGELPSDGEIAFSLFSRCPRKPEKQICHRQLTTLFHPEKSGRGFLPRGDHRSSRTWAPGEKGEDLGDFGVDLESGRLQDDITVLARSRAGCPNPSLTSDLGGSPGELQSSPGQPFPCFPRGLRGSGGSHKVPK